MPGPVMAEHPLDANAIVARLIAAHAFSIRPRS